VRAEKGFTERSRVWKAGQEEGEKGTEEGKSGGEASHAPRLRTLLMSYLGQSGHNICAVEQNGGQ